MKLHPSDARALYLQIMELIRREIMAGSYRSGDRLPSVRDLAVELRVNPNTVARAYALLQEEGVLEGRHGGGSFVTCTDDFSHKMAREHAAKELAEAVANARKMNISNDDIKIMIENILNGEVNNE